MVTTTVQERELSVLLPTFLRLGDDLTGINGQLESALGKLNRAISAAESLDPAYAALPLLRAKRAQMLRFQTALLQTEQHIQDQAVALEDAYAQSHGLNGQGGMPGLDFLFKKS